MKTIQKFLLVCVIASLSGLPVGAEPLTIDDAHAATGPNHSGKKGCSVRDIAGKWLFATSIGRQMLPDLPPDKDITAIGTWNVRHDGTLSGSFDVTVEDTFFFPGVGYEGSVVINSDCTGTVSFVTDLGVVRSDSIAVLSRSEIIGMSQDPFNLWTYQARRIGAIDRRTD